MDPFHWIRGYVFSIELFFQNIKDLLEKWILIHDVTDVPFCKSFNFIGFLAIPILLPAVSDIEFKLFDSQLYKLPELERHLLRYYSFLDNLFSFRRKFIGNNCVRNST